MLKKISLLCLVFILGESIAAQVGIYWTYEDFLEGNVEPFQKMESLKRNGGKFTVTFVDQAGKKHKFKLSRENIWGFVDETGRKFRVRKNKHPYVILRVGDIVYYENYSTQFLDEESAITQVLYRFPARFSMGLDGEMLNLSKRKLLKFFPAGSKGRQDLKQCKGKGDLVAFIDKYNSRKKHFSLSFYHQVETFF